MESNLLSNDFERMDIVSKVYDDANFSEGVKNKYACEEVKQKDNGEEECRASFLQNLQAFYAKESSHSSVYSQIDELTENQCTDFAFESSSGKEGALSYLEKAHAYLQNIEMAGMSPLSDEESSTVPDDGSSVTCDLGNDAKKGNPGNDAKKGMSLVLFFFCQFAMFLSTSSYLVFHLLGKTNIIFFLYLLMIYRKVLER